MVTAQSIAYFMTEFPRKTDTFIQREVSALRDEGADVSTFALRRPADDVMVGPEQVAHRQATTYLLSGTRALPTLLSLPRVLFRSSTVDALRLAGALRRPGVRGTLYMAFYLAEAMLLATQLRRKKIDHLHCHYGDVSSTIGVLAARMAATRFSFTLHGPGVFFEANEWRLGRKLDEADFVSCISWFCRSQAMYLASTESASKFHVVHCGVEPERFVGPGPGDASNGEIRLGFVARLEHVKGVPILLEAVASVIGSGVPVRLRIVGDGPERADYVRLASELGIADSVDFLGALSQAEVAEFLQSIDVFVLASFAEGVPVVLMEAMASALPVIATAVGGVGELVDDGDSGFMVAPSSVTDLADRVLTLASDADLRQRMGMSGRERVEQDFDSRTEASRLLALFDSVERSATIRPEPRR